MKKGIIYKYTSPSGKCYIGKTVNPKARKREHLHHSKTVNTKFYAAIRKYGLDSFSYEVLFDSPLLSINELNQLLNEKEIHFIQMYDSFNNGYNLSVGGDGQVGFKHKPETIKLYKKQKNNYSQKTLNKFSKTKINKKLSNKTIKKLN